MLADPVEGFFAGLGLGLGRSAFAFMAVLAGAAVPYLSLGFDYLAWSALYLWTPLTMGLLFWWASYGGWFSQEADCEFLPATPGSDTSHFSTDYADYRRFTQMKIGQGWRSKHSNPDNDLRFRGLVSAVICENLRNLRTQ